MIRLYHIVSIRMDNGVETYLTRYPMPHAECCIMLQRFTKHSFRRVQLKEINYE